MGQEKPFAYHVVGASGQDTIAIAPTLVDAVRLASDEMLSMIAIHAYFPENRHEVVPEERYSVQKLATREEALAFIRERDAKMKEQKEKSGEVSVITSLFGSGRCSQEDSEEKQVEDYIATSLRVWLPLEKIVEP